MVYSYYDHEVHIPRNIVISTSFITCHTYRLVATLKRELLSSLGMYARWCTSSLILDHLFGFCNPRVPQCRFD